MNKQLLLYLWQFQYFNKQSLKLDNGDDLSVIHPRRYNADRGPDFLNAKIQINNALWVGNVVLNLKVSDFQNGHHYDNVLLCVVWENDQPNLPCKVPVFSLKAKAQPGLLQKIQYSINIDSLAALDQQGRYNDENNQLSKMVANKTKQDMKTNEQINEPRKDKPDNFNSENGLPDNELRIINHLHEFVAQLKTVPTLLKGEVRSLKIIEWHRQTTGFQAEFGGYCKRVPKILLLGNWLSEAGFSCNERVQVIPLNSMLIIIPDKG